MGNTETIIKLAEDMVARDDPAIHAAEVCIQAYATLRQVAPDTADDAICSMGAARNPFVAMMNKVAAVTDRDGARAAVCLVMTKKGMSNPHARELKPTARKLNMPEFAGLAAACKLYPRESFADAVTRMTKLCKKAKIKIGAIVNASGVPRNTIYAWGTGSRSPRPFKQEKFCDDVAGLLHEKAIAR